MKKDIFKRILSVIMAVILCTGMLGGFSAFAAGEQVENYQLAFPRRGDVNYSDKWGHVKLKHMNGWFSDEAKYNTVFTIGSYSGPACYCIEPGTPIENKYKLTSRDESYWDRPHHYLSRRLHRNQRSRGSAATNSLSPNPYVLYPQFADPYLPQTLPLWKVARIQRYPPALLLHSQYFLRCNFRL